MLFTHSTALPGVPRNQQDNKLFCATLKAKQVVLPTRESMEVFRKFLDKTFEKSKSTRDQCLDDKAGFWDGVFQVAQKKDFGHVPYRNEYSGEILNITDEMWHQPPSANSIWPNPYHNFWLSWRYSNFKFQERGPGVGTNTAKCSKCEGGTN